MNKDLILSLLRKALTYGGGFLTSSGLATNDEITTGAGALVTLVGIAWSIYNRRQAAKAGTPPATTPTVAPCLVAGLLALGVVLGTTGCTTTTTTASDGTTTPTKSADWDTINAVSKIAAKYATKAVLDNNPDATAAVATVSAAVQTLLTGSPTLDTLTASLTALDTGLSATDIATLASVLKDAVDLYLAKSGGTALLATNEQVQALVKALTTGIAEGVALHNSATSS